MGKFIEAIFGLIMFGYGIYFVGMISWFVGSFLWYVLTHLFVDGGESLFLITMFIIFPIIILCNIE